MARPGRRRLAVAGRRLLWLLAGLGALNAASARPALASVPGQPGEAVRARQIVALMNDRAMAMASWDGRTLIIEGERPEDGRLAPGAGARRPARQAP